MVRIKERYLLVNVLQPPRPNVNEENLPSILSLHRPITDVFNFRTLQKAIRTEVKALFGTFGAGAVEIGFSVKYISCATSTLIIKVSRKYYRLVWAALTVMNTIPGTETPCIYRVVRVTGTIKQAEEAAIRQAQMLILAAKKDSNDVHGLLSFSGQDIMDVDENGE